MTEITITTNKLVHTVGSSMEIWGWEVPVYLFLGGLTAGILIVAAWMIWKDKDKEYPFATNQIILAAPVLISLGMFALFLDLEHKLYVWRFYTAFRITSVMSWGAWILVLIYPFSILLILGTFKRGFPKPYDLFFQMLDHSMLRALKPFALWTLDFAESHKKLIAKATLPVGILLGIYTGILLSTFSARPFWNSAILGPLFLISGLSTGVALILLFSNNKSEKRFFTKIDLGLIGIEMVLLLLFVIGMLTSTEVHQEAVKLILGGPLTPVFWVLIFSIGLSLPAILELLEIKGHHIPSALAASLVLIGGLALRFVIVKAGQISSWLPY